MKAISDRIDLRESALSIDEVIANVKHAGAGGITTFIGAVREESDGHAVSRLEYSAYDSMAKKEMIKIAEEIEAEVADARVSVIHRLGSLNVGDIAVVCAACAPHRGQAFQACRLLIDRIKSRVPIFKREWGPDGATWVGWVDARCAHDHP